MLIILWIRYFHTFGHVSWFDLVDDLSMSGRWSGPGVDILVSGASHHNRTPATGSHGRHFNMVYNQINPNKAVIFYEIKKGFNSMFCDHILGLTSLYKININPSINVKAKTL